MPENTHSSMTHRGADRRGSAGFTLIEVMIVVAIIGILATIALPAYRNYILRGQVVDASTLLSASRANMERYFQDNRTFAAVGTIYPPCDANLPVAQRTQGAFVLTCTSPIAPSATTYTLTATGTGPVAAFTYTVDQLDARTTTIASGGPSGWSGSTTCWVMKQGASC